mgnify:CR=1 FL=1
MAGRKKTGEIDTDKKVEKAPKETAVVDNGNQQAMLEQMNRMADLLQKSQDRIAQLEFENQKSKDSSEKKDNTKPIPMNPRSFAKYVKNLKDKKPRVFIKKFDELVKKGQKYGITVTPLEEDGSQEEVFKTTV